VLQDDVSYRVRLEGRAELLEQTLSRYRALKSVLGAFSWRRKLMRSETLVREVARAQAGVDEALEHVEHKSRVERWRDSSATLACAREVRALEESLYRLMGRKLKDGKGLSFSERLLGLERLAVAGPRRVLPGRRWEAALEALPRRLPELMDLGRFGARLEALFQRPVGGVPGRLPFSDAELAELETLWAPGEAALASAWARLGAVDTTGGVLKALRRRARRAPLKTPGNGPELLLHAEFWRNVAWVRLRALSDEVLSPVKLSDAELLPVMRWLARRQAGLRSRLELPDARAGLIGLSAELWLAVHQRGGDDGFWERLAEQAERADHGLSQDPDFVRLRENVGMLLRVLTHENRRPLEVPRRGRVEPTTLAGMVAEMRALLPRRATGRSRPA
jgi:hypothetical protein